jgi:molybdopterin converting factor small subunit
MQTRTESAKLARVTVRLFTALSAVAGENETVIEAGNVGEAL